MTAHALTDLARLVVTTSNELRLAPLAGRQRDAALIAAGALDRVHDLLLVEPEPNGRALGLQLEIGDALEDVDRETTR